MADEAQVAVIEQPPVEVPQTPPVSAEQQATAEAAAQQLLTDLQAPVQPDRQRDEHGRFVGDKPVVTAPVVPPPSRVDPVWVEAAKEAGLADTEISILKSDDEVQNAIATRQLGGQLSAMRTLGITPDQLTAYQQWQWQQQQIQQQQVAGAPSQQQQTAADPEFNLELDEAELAPELVKPIRAMADQLAKVTAAMTAGGKENQQLRQQLADVQGLVRQSAEQAQAAQREARVSHEWDQAAATVPGFTEYFGKPSDLRRLQAQNPNDPKVVDAAAFAGYFGNTWAKYSGILGESPRALQLALRDAWQASPFSRLNGNGRANGKNNNGTPQDGSVIRSSPRRASATSEPSVSPIEAEYERAMEVVGAAWDEGGQNPFAAGIS
jgi:hypothetical protein